MSHPPQRPGTPPSRLAGGAAPSRRAAPLPPDERRAALIAATLPLIEQHGMSVTTRQVAEAAGVAEGTIFRVFDSLEELINAAITAVFDPMPMLARMQAIDSDLPLDQRLVELVTILQQHFMRIFATMEAAGRVSPPRLASERRKGAHWRKEFRVLIEGLIEPDRDQLRCSPAQLAHLLRLLTFSGSHPQISDGTLSTPEEIVDVILNGTRARDDDLAGLLLNATGANEEDAPPTTSSDH
ncbi:MAG: TetR/AcrR family transcriptional regulator [Nocardioidaceae bacterium]